MRKDTEWTRARTGRVLGTRAFPGLQGCAGLKGSGDASRSCPRKRIGPAQLGVMVMMVVAVLVHDTSRC